MHSERLALWGQVNRIDETFARLRSAREKGFIAYIGAGDPDLAATARLAVEFEKAGVDIIELGVPFSDPLADGLVNQLAAQRGLESGTTPKKVLEMVRQARERVSVPIVLYVYFNLLHRFGLERFVAAAAAAGIDGLLILDLPPEESMNYEALMAAAGLCPIYLVAPTTPDERIALIAPRARGFIYYVSREGVTGMQAKVSESIAAMTEKIRRHAALPIAVGFGISNPEQARLVAAHAEAVVVGSAIVNEIARHGRSSELVREVSRFVQSLVQGVKGLHPGAI